VSEVTARHRGATAWFVAGARAGETVKVTAYLRKLAELGFLELEHRYRAKLSRRVAHGRSV
jgi:hypothetical protein